MNHSEKVKEAWENLLSTRGEVKNARKELDKAKFQQAAARTGMIRVIKSLGWQDKWIIIGNQEIRVYSEGVEGREDQWFLEERVFAGIILKQEPEIDLRCAADCASNKVPTDPNKG